MCCFIRALDLGTDAEAAWVPWLFANRPFPGFPSLPLSPLRENEGNSSAAASTVARALLQVPAGVLGPGAEGTSVGSQRGNQLLERVFY